MRLFSNVYFPRSKICRSAFCYYISTFSSLFKKNKSQLSKILKLYKYRSMFISFWCIYLSFSLQQNLANENAINPLFEWKQKRLGIWSYIAHKHFIITKYGRKHPTRQSDFTYALESANYNNSYLSLHNQNLNVQSINLSMKT